MQQAQILPEALPRQSKSRSSNSIRGADERPAFLPSHPVSASAIAWRHEWKYVVPASARTAISADLRAFADPDKVAGPDGYSTVRSLYFDTIDWSGLFDKLDGVPVRRKLRIRAYLNAQHAAARVKFEIKHRCGEHIGKQVASVSREDYERWQPLLQSHRLGHGLTKPTQPALEEFFRLKHLFGMRPVLNVQFRRQAFVARSPSGVRVTFDDSLVGWTAVKLFDRVMPPSGPTDRSHSIFEVKSKSTLPFWLDRLIQKYRLQRGPFSKYATLVAMTGPLA